MLKGIEPLYQKIAESIQGKINGPWLSARMDVIFYPQHIFFSGEYVSSNGTKPKSFPTDIEGEHKFEKIRELFKLAGKPLWGRAYFELYSDGKFKVNWDYDNCDENGFARFDENAEIKRMAELRKRLG